METATLTAKGQTTIPKRIREHLGLSPGDEIRFFVMSDGSVVMLPKTTLEEVRGCLGPAPRKLTIEQMNEAIAKMGQPLPND
jgi:antitoxin PrlF